MEASPEEGEQHQTPEKCKSPTYAIKEWVPVCEEGLKPKQGLEFATRKNVRNSINLMLIMLVLVFVSHLLRRTKKACKSINTLFALNKDLGKLRLR